ncbi:hypothetical protein TNCV_1240041 [Trichonephila clavipes]|nr:hypothetical protein TNCV_1240041 [Trichonephila clavipes]
MPGASRGDPVFGVAHSTALSLSSPQGVFTHNSRFRSSWSASPSKTLGSRASSTSSNDQPFSFPRSSFSTSLLALLLTGISSRHPRKRTLF